MTYPRRAAGLVKKGRAYYMNDFIIRLNMSDTTLPDGREKSEVMKMDNHITIDNTDKKTENQVFKLYFNPRKWSFNKDCKNNVGNRSFITGPDGVLAESYMIGDWSYNWTEIVSETLLLPKNTDCSFTFWLNGGENDRNDEVCRFEVLFNNDFEQRLTYNLNRNYISPVKKLNGWELYEIPFRTEDNEYTQLRFVSQKAYLTILAAKDAAAYAEMPDTTDPFEGERPQRHNIIFSDGFPTNSWYSTKALQDAHIKRDAVNAAFQRDISVNGQSGSSENALQNPENTLKQVTNEFQTSANIRLNAISSSLDALSSTCDMLEDLDVKSLADNISIKHGGECEEELGDILSDVADSISDMVDELRDRIDEMADQIEEIRDSLSI